MAVYIITFILIMILAGLIHPERGGRRRKRFIISSFGILILISSLRKYTVGTDLRLYYYNSFRQFLNWDWKDYNVNIYETGYYFYNILIGKLTSDPQIFIAITSIFTFLIFAWFIYKNSQDIYMSVFLFIALHFWFMYMNIIRQTIAVCIVLIASEILKSKKIRKMKYFIFIVMIILASTFHNSALIMLVLFPLSFIQFERKEILTSIFLVLIAIFTYSKIFVLLSGFINHRNYVDVYLAQGEADISVIGYFSALMYTAIFILGSINLVIKRNKKIASNRYILIDNDNGYTDDYLMYMLLIIMITRILSIKLTIIGRISYYFYPFIWIALPRIMSRISSINSRQILRSCIYFCGILLFLVIGYLRGAMLYGTIPYEFFWD